MNLIEKKQDTCCAQQDNASMIESCDCQGVCTCSQISNNPEHADEYNACCCDQDEENYNLIDMECDQDCDCQ